MPTKDTLWCVKDLAKMLNVKPTFIYKMIEDNKIPYITLGRKTYRFKPKAIEAWLNQESNINEQQKGIKV